ncbi:hypothetical protein [Allochromatium tepidum]|uniref:Uncharacterized protein n=1 Tax=Allochromatium tepidum TaxID=553982 RepID=A0ABN6GBA9_9GAMM|nr:hypothetical protein [Allochromatium tepidum]BCU06934.1 hypothetical protein Atep_16110 [Allochromatium tepidum]
MRPSESERGPSLTLESIALVRCKSAGLCLALEAAKIGAMHDLTEDPTAPSLADLLQQPESPEPPRQRLLEIRHPDWRRLVRVGEPVIHFELPVRALQPCPPLLAARQCANGVRALAWIEEPSGVRLLIILDAWRLPVLEHRAGTDS